MLLEAPSGKMYYAHAAQVVKARKDVKWAYGTELSEEQASQMHALVTGHKIHFGMHDLGRHSTHQMRLDLVDEKPVFCPRHRLSRVEWEIVDKSVAKLLKHGLIEPTKDNFAAATVLPVKKGTDDNCTDRRMCGDYRMLNLKTK